MMREQWSFSALDTLFFKEPRPMESVGGSHVSSVFPPPARTLIGAIRTCVGEAHNVDWREYAGTTHPLHAIMGTPDSLGPLQFCGPYLLSGEHRLYPSPLACLVGTQGQTRLLPAPTPISCDLGTVHLPVKADPDMHGAKPLENTFVTSAGLSSFLSGNPIPANEFLAAADLYVTEERLGIARDNNRGVTGDGQLYQTRHIRPVHSAALKVAMGIRGLSTQNLSQSGLCRLGAEGRMAAWQRETAAELPEVTAPLNPRGIVLMLLTPGLFSGGWLPDGFKVTKHIEARVWEGCVADVRLRLLTSVVGKPVREGGWDMVQRAPRPLLSYVPAGSCYFCEVIDGDVHAAQRKLHGFQLGQETEYGRGELAVGYW